MSNFWEEKSLVQMTPEEWDALCDRCGKCCLHKLEDPDDGEVTYTKVACRLLDLHTCQCTNYKDRHVFVPDCVPLDMEMVKDIEWLPKTCSYRLLYTNMPLPAWHYLLSGDLESIHQAGVSVRGRAISERKVKKIERHVVEPEYWD